MLVHSRVFALVATVGAGLVLAQSLPVSLSSSCITTVKGLLVSPDAACMNPSAFLSLALGNQSVPNVVNNWLTGLCASGSCSDASLAAIVTNITQGCSDDFSSAGVDAASLQSQITQITQQVYPTARKVACLKDTSADQFCVTQTLNNLENVIGTLSINDLSLFDLIADVQKLLTSNIPSLACTNCTKEAFTIAQQDFPDIASQAIQPIENVCGASFVDGTSADGVVQTAAQGQFVAQVQNNGSTTMKPFKMAGLGLLLISAFFMTF